MSTQFVPDFGVNLQLCAWKNARFLIYMVSFMERFSELFLDMAWPATKKGLLLFGTRLVITRPSLCNALGPSAKNESHARSTTCRGGRELRPGMSNFRWLVSRYGDRLSCTTWLQGAVRGALQLVHAVRSITN